MPLLAAKLILAEVQGLERNKNLFSMCRKALIRLLSYIMRHISKKKSRKSKNTRISMTQTVFCWGNKRVEFEVRYERFW